MIFNLIVACVGFVIASFDGLRAYHRKSIQSLVFMLNHCICITMLILDDNPIWYPLVLFVLYGFMLFLVIEDAHRVVHGEVGKQKLWNTLRGWYYLSISRFFDWVHYYSPTETVLERFEEYYIMGFCYAYLGYFPLKTTSWDDLKKELGINPEELDSYDEVGYHVNQD